MRSFYTYTFIFLIALVLPIYALNAQATSATAKTLSEGGVFGCNGAKYGAVGAQGPKGAHVPVFDAALFDQQRILTYKVCLLDGIASSARETMLSLVAKNVIDWAQKGQDGSGAFVTNLAQRRLKVSDRVAQDFINNIDNSNIPEIYKPQVRDALIRKYAANTRGQKLNCPLTKQQIDGLKNNTLPVSEIQDVWSTYNTNPGCNVDYVQLQQQLALDSAIEKAVRDDQTQLNWGNGFIPVTKTETVDIGGGRTIQREKVVTPGYLIAQQISQVLGTGMRQAENATEVTSLISSMFANLGTRMLTDINGFAGLSASSGGQPSFLTQLVNNSAQKTRDKMVGAAGAILQNAFKNEISYQNARKSALSSFLSAKTQLHSWERVCFADMADAAQTSIVDKVKQRVCPQSAGTSTIPCSQPITVTKTYDSNTLMIDSPQAGVITVSGYAQRSDSTIEVIISDSATSTQATTTPDSTSSLWTTVPIDISTLAAGTTTVTETEKFKNRSGTHTVVATITKDAQGALTLPTDLPNITISASAGGINESVTLTQNTDHSSTVIATNITPNEMQIHTDVAKSSKALAALDLLKTSLSNALTTSGKKAILTQIDQLVVNGVLHTSSDVRNALAQADQTKTLTTNLLDTTKKQWEGGWCQPDNWVNYKAN